MVDLTMSAEANALTPGEYIRHHLQHLQVPQKQNGIVDFSVINLDSVLFSIVLGAFVCFMLYRAAKKVHAGVPGRFQAAVEILVEMVDTQAKAVIHNAESRKLVGPMALTVFLWIFMMNFMDMLPVICCLKSGPVFMKPRVMIHIMLICAWCPPLICPPRWVFLLPFC